MLYSEAYIRELFDYACTRIKLQDDYGAILEGSIAEGFGNASSDVDFLVVTPKHENRELMPLIVFHDGRRIEVRFRSAVTLAEQLEAFKTYLDVSDRKIEQIPEDTLNRLQRFLNCMPLRNEPLRRIITLPFRED